MSCGKSLFRSLHVHVLKTPLRHAVHFTSTTAAAAFCNTARRSLLIPVGSHRAAVWLRHFRNGFDGSHSGRFKPSAKSASAGGPHHGGRRIEDGCTDSTLRMRIAKDVSSRGF